MDKKKTQIPLKIAMREGGVINQNPEDFKLCAIGEFDDLTGEFSNGYEKVCDAIKQES